MSSPHRGDRGYAVILTALLLVPLLAAASVAIDLGSRYAEAAKIQRAADAGALAGVAVLPRGLTAARTEARQVAARNGYEHGVNSITVDVTQINAEEISVRIQDSSVPEYFGSLFNGDPHIARSATARYVRAVSLGSPRNFLGTGNLLGGTFTNDMQQLVGKTSAESGGLRENYFLAISGECSSKENGDRFNTISQANFENTSNPRGLAENQTWDDCDVGGSVQANPEFRDYGYIYAVNVPSGYDLGQMRIQAFDPAICDSSRAGDPSNASSGGMTTTFTVRSGSTDPLGGTPVASPSQPRSFNRSSSNCSTWTDIAIVSPPVAGTTYFIQVDAGANSAEGTMSNGFALRASVDGKNSGGRFWGCSSDPVETTLHDAKCPQVYAVQDMGVFAAITRAKAEFFLAEVGPEYNGKRLEITLFDPGEGADSLRVKQPNGLYATFDWRVDCPNGATPPFGGCSGSGVSTLDLIGDTRTPGQGCSSPDIDTSTPRDGTNDRCVFNSQPGPRRSSRSKYNERSLKVTIDLPDDITAAYGGATWWKIEYTLNSAPTDRTTWSVEVKGDPVRLIPNP